MVSIVVQNLVEIDAGVSKIWNFQYIARLVWKRLFTPPKLGFSVDFTPKWGAMSTKPPKGTSAGRNGSSSVLVMSLSVIVPEKLRGNKVWQRRTTHFWPFWHRCKIGCDMVVCNFFHIYMFILSRTARWCQYLINSASHSFFWGCQNRP